MKGGISLTTNTLVYLIIGILILGAVVAILILFGQEETPKWDVMYRNSCLELLTNCDQDLNNVGVESGGTFYTLREICTKLGMNDDECKENCGCVV